MENPALGDPFWLPMPAKAAPRALRYRNKRQRLEARSGSISLALIALLQFGAKSLNSSATSSLSNLCKMKQKKVDI